MDPILAVAPLAIPAWLLYSLYTGAAAGGSLWAGLKLWDYGKGVTGKGQTLEMRKERRGIEFQKELLKLQRGSERTMMKEQANIEEERLDRARQETLLAKVLEGKQARYDRETATIMKAFEMNTQMEQQRGANMIELINRSMTRR